MGIVGLRQVGGHPGVSVGLLPAEVLTEQIMNVLQASPTFKEKQNSRPQANSVFPKEKHFCLRRLISLGPMVGRQ